MVNRMGFFEPGACSEEDYAISFHPGSKNLGGVMEIAGQETLRLPE